MPYLLNIVIICFTSAEPQRSHCSTRIVRACPEAIRPDATRTALSLVEPPECIMNEALAWPAIPSSSTMREKIRSAWSVNECRFGISRIVSTSRGAIPASFSASRPTWVRPSTNPRSGKRPDGNSPTPTNTGSFEAPASIFKGQASSIPDTLTSPAGAPA